MPAGMGEKYPDCKEANHIIVGILFSLDDMVRGMNLAHLLQIS